MRRSQASRLSIVKWSAVIVPIACGAILAGCSADARSRVMHFFFEYPEPKPASAPSEQPMAAPDSSEALPTPKKVSPRFASRHAPFAARECQSCHVPGAGQAPRPDFSEACRECHAPYFEYHRFTHGPVATEDCRFCHTMHTSPYPALQTSPQAEMCTSCHDAQQDDAALTSYHKGIDAVACTSCHDPHFADNSLLLKAEEVRRDVRRRLDESRSVDTTDRVSP